MRRAVQLLGGGDHRAADRAVTISCRPPGTPPADEPSPATTPRMLPRCDRMTAVCAIASGTPGVPLEQLHAFLAADVPDDRGRPRACGARRRRLSLIAR